MTKTDNSASRWWDWHLFGLWVLVNAAAFVVIPLVGVIAEQLASAAAKNLAQHHRALTVVIIAIIGAALQGIVVGRWQWRLLQRRLPGLERRRWVTATVFPVFAVWLLAIAPQAVDLMAQGGDTLTVFRNGFIQALVLGPLIGLSQATALRDQTSRWAWWVVANVTTYLTGVAAHAWGVWIQHQLSLPAQTPAFFPVLAFVVHGAWMLWVTAPQAASPATPPRPAAHPGRVRRRGG
jgi:hypothetical protein